jgi:hypothetical protein
MYGEKPYRTWAQREHADIIQFIEPGVSKGKACDVFAEVVRPDSDATPTEDFRGFSQSSRHVQVQNLSWTITASFHTLFNSFSSSISTIQCYIELMTLSLRTVNIPFITGLLNALYSEVDRMISGLIYTEFVYLRN